MANASTSTSVLEKEQLLRDDYVPASSVPASRSSGLRGFAESSANALSSVLAPALNPLNKVIAKMDAYREHLELPYPGQVDQLGKECKSERSFLDFLLRFPRFLWSADSIIWRRDRVAECLANKHGIFYQTYTSTTTCSMAHERTSASLSI